MLEKLNSYEPPCSFEEAKAKVEGLPLFRNKIDLFLSRSMYWKKETRLQRESEKARLLDQISKEKTRSYDLEKNLLAKLNEIEEVLFRLLKKISSQPDKSELNQSIDINSGFYLDIAAKMDGRIVYELSLKSKNTQIDDFTQNIGSNGHRMYNAEVLFRRVRILTTPYTIQFLGEIFARPSIGTEWQGAATLLIRLTHRLNRVALDALQEKNQVAFASLTDFSENEWSKRRAEELGFLPGRDSLVPRKEESDHILATSPDGFRYTVRQLPSGQENHYTYFYT